MGPRHHPPTPEMPSPAAVGRARSPGGAGQARERHLPQAPSQPPNRSVDPVLRASPSPHRCGLCIQGCDPTNHCPAPPPPPEAPGGPAPLPWCPGLAVLLPRAKAEPGSEVSGPKSPPRPHIPPGTRSSGRPAGPAVPGRRRASFITSLATPSTLERGAGDLGKNKQQAYCLSVLMGKAGPFLSAAPSRPAGLQQNTGAAPARLRLQD